MYRTGRVERLECGMEGASKVVVGEMEAGRVDWRKLWGWLWFRQCGYRLALDMGYIWGIVEGKDYMYQLDLL